MVVGGNEFCGRLIAFFCLRADVADGFIQKDGYARCLFFMGLFVEVDAVALGYFLTEYGGLAVYFDPALFNVAVCLAARA